MSNICDDLRAAILQAAMQGKLTKQLPEDGNVEDLFRKIISKKESAIKNGLVKKQKNAEPLASMSFDIPDSWRWTQLSDLVYIYSGLAYNKKDLDEKIIDEVTVFRGGNISNMSYCFKADDIKIDKKFIPKSELFLRKNQLITPAVTSQSNLGKIARIGTDYTNVVAGGFVLNIVPYDIDNDVFSKLFCYFFSSPFYKERCNEIANKSGQAFYNLNRTKLQESAFPLPPLAEQKRIVEKVDELMARVADLEQSADALALLKKAFPDDIKASLLQYAMQGKLTKQLPEDGDAKDLLEEIKVEKEKLVAEGKIKKQKPLASITDNEIPFSIPENWKWVRFGDVNELISGTDLTPDKYTSKPEGIVYITGASNIQDGRIIQNRWTKNASRISKKGDLLLTCKGTIGTTAILDIDEAHIARQIMAIRPVCIDVYYIKYFIEYMVPALKAAAKSMIPGIERGNVLNMLLPLPPLIEQKRIVEHLNILLQNINTVGELIASE